MAERTWSLSRVFANVLATSARGLWAGKAPGAGIPHAPQLAFAGLQLQQPSDTKSLWQDLTDVLGAIWLAVPKKRTSRARRNMRSAPKYLRWDHSIIACVKCGAPRRPHTYCDKFECGRPDKNAGMTTQSKTTDPETSS